MIVLVAGLPGSGKSYFATHLARKLGALYINSDQVRQALQAGGKYSFKDKLAVYKRMLLEATSALEAGKQVVVDATFYHHTLREMFVRLAQGYDSAIRIIEVIADEAIIRERLGRPRKYSEADLSVYEKVRDDFEAITMPHLTLQSTDDNLEAMLEAAIHYIEREGK